MASAEETLYCLCRKPYDKTQFMIECESCKDWFHGRCVGVAERQAADIESYHCPTCQGIHGPLVLKKRRNWHRHDYSESDVNISKAIQTGTIMFIKELKHRNFPSAYDLPILQLHGSQLNTEFFDENGFDIPILVHKKEGLGMSLPPPSFAIQDVENHVGSMLEIDVIDVGKQEDYKMLMRNWTEYFNSPNRSKIYNVISLEFSKTKLSKVVVPPAIVRQLSWANTVWPDNVPDEKTSRQPDVHKYCLMGVKDSFTDFHIDFGGTSVWYHVLWGEKVFYFVRPTPTNLELYENWVSSPNQSETFFGDMVDMCYKCVVRQGQTVFIPTGWIHAVLTPIDSLVFGGNFLHSYSIDLQLQVYELEKRVKTEEKYLFPLFEPMNWYAAKHVLDILHDHSDENSQPLPHILNGAKALTQMLKIWTQRKEFIKSQKLELPETIEYGKLLKDLQKEVKHIQKQGAHKESSKDSKPSKKKKDKKKSGKGGVKREVEVEEEFAGDALLWEEMEREEEERIKKEDEKKKEEEDRKKREAVYDFDVDTDLQNEDDEDPFGSSPLRVKIPRADSPRTPSKSPKSPRSPRTLRLHSPGAKLKHSPGFKTQNPGIKLKIPKQEKPPIGQLSMGIASDDQLGASLKFKLSGGKMINTPTINSPKRISSQELISSHRTSSQDSGSPRQFRRTSSQESASDSDTDQKPIASPTSSPHKHGSLRFKLSFSGKPLQDLTQSSSQDSQQDSDLDSSRLNSSYSDLEKDQKPNKGAINWDIGDILEASGYSSSGPEKEEAKIEKAPPSMRDAIQGMLSMSQGGTSLLSGPSILTLDPLPSTRPTLAPFKAKPPPIPPKVFSDDRGEVMPMCFKDEEYVYPTLDHSDGEQEHVFKPRGRPPKDETWNPKARLIPNCPKPERPAREGVRRESVESGLAAAAAKLATMPRPKRQYIRKKPKRDRPNMAMSYSSDMFDNPQAGTSSDLTIDLSQSAPASTMAGAKRPLQGALKSGLPLKKPKKGQATAKQRLGKILKLHKFKK
ncbi:unnamed protein product [Owenia fusiformis]|uniref:Uncharacterized protein n=1 Tax=Owenia fusiformis TaxID=6347 RepID=A0A8S4NU46_OWEFU|nr:unnamed protein product [Owenia fusiformis]